MAKEKEKKMSYAEMDKSAEEIRISHDIITAPQPGFVLIGKLMSKETVEIPLPHTEGEEAKKTSLIAYLFDTDEGLKQILFGASIDKQVELEAGHIYKATYGGKKPLPGGKMLNMWDIRELIL